jgi:hypothetical protein
MLLDPYFSECDNIISITAAQASQFAKQQCQDFNPIHDPDNKRFCVPGDLLFSLALLKYGISESMTFEFTGMVGDNVGLLFPETSDQRLVVTNGQGKSVLEVEKKGETSFEPSLLDALVKNYVVFSGQNFPTLLVPLMQQHQVMFNPTRPLVMYNSMSFELTSLQFKSDLQVKLRNASLEVNGKRANEYLHFDIFDGEQCIGKGVKKMIISGLKPYDDEAMSAFSSAYEAHRDAF